VCVYINSYIHTYICICISIYTHILSLSLTHTHTHTHLYAYTVRDNVESSEEAQAEKSQGEQSQAEQSQAAPEQSYNSSLHQNEHNTINTAHGDIENENRLAALVREKNLGIGTRRRAVKRKEHPWQDLQDTEDGVLWEWTNSSIVGDMDEREVKRHRFAHVHDDGVIPSSRYDFSALAEKNKRNTQVDKSGSVQGAHVREDAVSRTHAQGTATSAAAATIHADEQVFSSSAR
jgi:hypothetical protein